MERANEDGSRGQRYSEEYFGGEEGVYEEEDSADDEIAGDENIWDEFGRNFSLISLEDEFNASRYDHEGLS